MRVSHVKQLEGYTYMDHECTHFRGIFLKPAIWIEFVTVLAEKFRVAVEDPWIYAKNGLEFSSVRATLEITNFVNEGV